jgi:hypothetical protein
MDDGQALPAKKNLVSVNERYIRGVGWRQAHQPPGFFPDFGIFKKKVILGMETTGDIVGLLKNRCGKKLIGVAMGMKKFCGGDLFFSNEVYHCQGIISGINDHRFPCLPADQKIGIQIIGAGHPSKDLNLIGHSY